MEIKRIVIHPIKYDLDDIWTHSAILQLNLHDGSIITHNHDPKSDKPQMYNCNFSPSNCELTGNLFTYDRISGTGFSLFNHLPTNISNEIHIYITAGGPFLAFNMRIRNKEVEHHETMPPSIKTS
uniref:Uncharacterized protein n=1 Tax=Marseillevirus LCMAC102 TaxID=2506603 RepID=A0A481YU50_9VIRU|nr:MAG: hypothetical protein LCMAC102_00900 [Marseillevirus LCMAC102]